VCGCARRVYGVCNADGAYLEHVRARGAHDPDPTLCALKRIFPLRRPLGPSFKVGEWLEDQDLKT